MKEGFFILFYEIPISTIKLEVQESDKTQQAGEFKFCYSGTKKVYGN